MHLMVIRIALFSIALTLFLFPVAIGYGQDSTKITLQKITSEQNQLRAEVTRLQDALKQIEWERKSHKQIIEHMRENQSSSLWLINFILVWALGLFAVLGVVGGLVSLAVIIVGNRNLRKLREDYESGLADLEKRKEDIARQNRAIRSLKPILIAGRLIDRDDHRRAGFYIDRALSIDPESDVALYMKLQGFIETGQMSASLKLLEKLQKMHPSDPDTVTNLLELYLLTGQLKKYKDNNELWQDLLNEKNEMENGLLVKYFDALYLYMAGDVESMKQLITSVLDGLLSEKAPANFHWDFSEAERVLASRPY